MRVGFNARYLYDPGLRGFNRYSLCLLRAFQDIPDIDMTLFSEKRYPVHEVYRSTGRAVKNLQASHTLLWEQCVLPRWLKRLNVDVFHAPAEGGLPLRKACPYVLTYHGVPDRSLSFLLESGELPGTLDDYLDSGSDNQSLRATVAQYFRKRVLLRNYLRSADLIITVSEFSKAELIRFLNLPAAKVRVIHEAADSSFAEPLSEAYIEEILGKHRIPSRFILFVGGFDKRKNVRTLLSAFAAVRRMDPEIALVLVGIGGDIESSRLRSAALGLEEGSSVIFLQRLPDQELAAVYRAATLFTTLSWHEGFCLPVVEAMTCGTPVLASSFGAIPEIVGDGGWLVDPRRQEAIVHAMLAILSQTKLQEELRVRGMLRSQAFSWRRTAFETWAVYKELCPT